MESNLEYAGLLGWEHHDGAEEGEDDFIDDEEQSYMEKNYDYVVTLVKKT